MSENTGRFNARYENKRLSAKKRLVRTLSTLPSIPPHQPVLIAGPTASGKSALALEIAQEQGGVIVNADAIQVYNNWRILTARPSIEEESQAPHVLYGHIQHDAEYSVGHWLREIAPILTGPERPIITGGTGLYFMALTQGLAEIPPTPADIRAEADIRVKNEGFEALLAELDSETASRIDQRNPMRVQRAWEVLHTTGRPLAAWQDDTPAPLLPLANTSAILFDVDRDWLNERIGRRFDLMLKQGALDEARTNFPSWDPTHLSAKAIGATELMAHIRGEITLDEAREFATVATRQFAKRQRTWFRSKMRDWHAYRPDVA